MDAAIIDSQVKKEFVIEGVAYSRVACGYETGTFADGLLDREDATCVKCYAPCGFFHVLGCGLEQCPICGEGALGCLCRYDASETWKVL